MAIAQETFLNHRSPVKRFRSGLTQALLITSLIMVWKKPYKSPPITHACLPQALPSEWCKKQQVPRWTSQGALGPDFSLKNPPQGTWGGGGQVRKQENSGSAAPEWGLPHLSQTTTSEIKSCFRAKAILSLHFNSLGKSLKKGSLASLWILKSYGKMILQQFKEKKGVFTFLPPFMQRRKERWGLFW